MRVSIGDLAYLRIASAEAHLILRRIRRRIACRRGHSAAYVPRRDTVEVRDHHEEVVDRILRRVDAHRVDPTQEILAVLRDVEIFEIVRKPIGGIECLCDMLRCRSCVGGVVHAMPGGDGAQEREAEQGSEEDEQLHKGQSHGQSPVELRLRPLVLKHHDLLGEIAPEEREQECNHCLHSRRNPCVLYEQRNDRTCDDDGEQEDEREGLSSQVE
mmetsp:Transcript_100736/g.282293  ORF Transcript_100736/g.282293 Transcript_100736/m.282293 type:complete len:214 (+) Transcript_100736:1011-1652(+)